MSLPPQPCERAAAFVYRCAACSRMHNVVAAWCLFDARNGRFINME
jgi:hypothetical protein